MAWFSLNSTCQMVALKGNFKLEGEIVLEGKIQAVLYVKPKQCCAVPKKKVCVCVCGDIIVSIARYYVCRYLFCATHTASEICG